MFDVFDLVAKITLDSSDYEKKLSEAHSSASSMSSKIGGAMKTIGTISGAALGVAAAAVVSLTKQSVDAFANYEQLVGGVETLYKKDAKRLQKLADQAYKTAGLSANAYMEQATSMAAALVGSLGGDTEKAVDAADMAIRDMSDNANKMGTSMESIQNAYNGFAKQNYTMLDNLKLGYGGTKSEMERLVLDAESLNSTFKATRDENGDLAMSYADIVDAIHIVQENMGITGTTAKEAGDTISGSVGSVKAAWDNLLISFGRGGDETQVAMQNLIDSVSGMLTNLIPTVSNILIQIANSVPTLVTMISEKLPEFVSEFVPKIISTASEILFALISALPGMITQLASTIIDTVLSVDWMGLGTQMWDAIKSAFLVVASWTYERFTEAFTAIQGIDWIGLGADIWSWISENLGGVGAWFKEKFDEAVEFINGIDWPALGSSIWNGIIGAIGKISEVAGESGVAGWFKEKFEEAKSAVLSIDWEGLGKGLWDTFVLGLSTVVDWFTGVFTDAKDAIKDIDWEKLGEDIWDFVKKAFAAVVDYFSKLFTGARNTIKNDIDWEALGTAIRDFILAAFSAIADTFKGIWEGVKQTIHDIDWSQLGKDVLAFIVDEFNNVAETLSNLWEAAKTAIHDIDWAGLGSDIWGFIVGAMGIPIEGISGWFKAKFNEAKDWIADIDWAGLGTIIWDGIKEAFFGVLDFFTDLFDFSNIHIKFPHITVTEWWEPGFGISIPWSWGVEWYRKAYDQPWLFNKKATVGNFGFGDGGRSGELVYGRDSLMRDIREAAGGGNSGPINITLNAYQNIDENTEDFARRVGEILSEQLNREEASFA